MYPVLLAIGPVRIYSFGLFLALGIIIGSFVVWREGRNAKLDEQKLVDFLLAELLFGLLGARIYYLLLHFADFGLAPFKWFLFFHFPGLSFIGAIFGGLIGAFIFARRQHWSFWQLGDFLVLGLSLGEAMGRIGAFLGGSAYGQITNLPWGVPMIGLLGKRHPTQIYELIAAVLTFLLLVKLEKKWQERQLPTGLNFLFYFLIFGITRFFLEIFRGDSVYFLGWRTTQIVCLFFILSATVFLFRRLGRNLKTDFLVVLTKIKNLKFKKGNYV